MRARCSSCRRAETCAGTRIARSPNAFSEGMPAGASVGGAIILALFSLSIAPGETHQSLVFKSPQFSAHVVFGAHPLTLILKRASASRPSGEWNDDDYDVLADRSALTSTKRRPRRKVGPSQRPLSRPPKISIIIVHEFDRNDPANRGYPTCAQRGKRASQGGDCVKSRQEGL